MMGAEDFNTSARAVDKRTVKPKLGSYVLNKVDKTVVGVSVGSLLVGGLFVEFLNLMFRKNKIECKDNPIIQEKIMEKIENDPDFALTDQQQRIYENTKKLCEKLLTCVDEYIRNYGKQPLGNDLDQGKKSQKEILELIGLIRCAWIGMYGGNKYCPMENEIKNALMKNEPVYTEKAQIPSVTLSSDSLSSLFEGLPIRDTYMSLSCLPYDASKCITEMPFLARLHCLHCQYQKAFSDLWDKWKEEQKKN